MTRSRGLAAAAAALVAAVFLRWLLDPLLGDRLPVALLFGAVVAAYWFAGLRVAVAVALLGYAASAYLFIPPRAVLGLPNAVNAVGFAVYAVTCALIVGFGHTLRRAQARADEQGELLRRKEQDRAGELSATRLLAAIVASSDDAIISKSLDGTIRSWNAGAERLFGHGAGEAVGRHISLIIPPERLAEEDAIIASIKAGERVDHVETERVRRDGRRITVSLTVSPIKDDAGRVVGASKIARDVTSRRELEAERQNFVTLVENSTDFIGICDINGVPFFVNRAGLALIGLDSLEAARRTSVWEFFFPEDRARIRDEFFPAVLAQGHGEIEIRFRNFKTGAARWMAYKVVALADPSGKPVAFATVSQDVTERRQLADDLRRLADDLTQADRRKNEFLATLAHELRNPLAPITNMLEVLKRAEGSPVTLKRAREIIDRQTKQLVRLVDDLLEINRITHDRLELRRDEVELGTVLREAVESAHSLVEAASLELVVELPEEPLPVHADPARLSQVFGNLISNGCKYTPAGGTLTISAVRQGAEAVVRVTDTGIGIPSEKLEAVFGMFTRLDQSLIRDRGGLGIGLTLVRRLVGMHGGTVQALSDGEGRGSAFVVRLPVLGETRAAATPAAHSPRVPFTR